MKSLSDAYDKDPRRFVAWSILFFALGVSAWLVKTNVDNYAAVIEAGALASSPAQALTTFDGEFEVVILDDFENSLSSNEYFIRDNKGQMKKLEVSRIHEDVLAALKTGDKVKVKGSQNVKKEIEAANIQVVEAAVSTEPQAYVEYDETGAASVVMDERHALNILLDFSDKTLTTDVSGVTSLMYTGTQNIDNFYRTATYGHLGFIPDTNGDGSPDVIGPFTLDGVSTLCDIGSWANQADAFATQAGYDLTKYQHILYMLPTNVCPAAGYGGGNRAWIFHMNFLDLLAHEIGHTLGMSHASTDPENDGTINSEYGDMSDVMGYSGSPLRLFNGAHDWKSNWINSFPSQAVTVTGSGEYMLAPLSSDPSVSPYPQVLRIPKRGSATDYYYVSFRKKEGYDGSLGTSYIQGAAIHWASSAVSGRTALIKTLSATDNVWADPQGSGLTITQLEKAADNSYVRVSIDSQIVCTPTTPTVTLSPTSQVSSVNTDTFNFSLTVRNNDDLCGASTFTPSFSSSALTGSFNPTDAVLDPGASKMFTLTVNSASTADKTPFTVTVSDTDGVTPTHTDVSVSGDVSVDLTAPTAPTLSGSFNSKQSAVNLSWTASSDNVAVTGYDILRNGTLITTVVSGTSYADKPPVSGTYTYNVRARDAANNVSPMSNTVMLNVTVKTKGGGSGGGKGGGRPR